MIAAVIVVTQRGGGIAEFIAARGIARLRTGWRAATTTPTAANERETALLPSGSERRAGSGGMRGSAWRRARGAHLHARGVRASSHAAHGSSCGL